MLEQLLDYLKTDLDTLRKEVRTDIGRIEDKIDILLAFKWKIMGGTIVASLVAGILVQIFLAWAQRHG